MNSTTATPSPAVSTQTEDEPISIAVLAGAGQTIEVGEGGRIGDITRAAYGIHIKIARGTRVVQILDERVHGGGPMKNVGQIRSGNTFEHKVVVNQTGTGKLKTISGENNIRFVVIHGNDRITYYDVALIAQDETLWLTAQVKAKVNLLRGHDGSLKADSTVRPELLEVLNGLNLIKKAELPPFTATSVKKEEKEVISLANGQGVCKWYDEGRQVGVLDVQMEGKRQQVKIHWSDCPVHPSGRKFLREGWTVNVGKLIGNCDRHSSLKFQAKEVTIR